MTRWILRNNRAMRPYGFRDAISHLQSLPQFQVMRSEATHHHTWHAPTARDLRRYERSQTIFPQMTG